MQEDGTSMKKKVILSAAALLSVLLILVIAGVITNYADSARVGTGHEPKYCIKTVSDDGSKVTYWGLGYKVVRYVGVSPDEPYASNIGVKMGSWFMEYELPQLESITVELEGRTLTIDAYEDVSRLQQILKDSRYDSELCDGIITHTITAGDEVYYLLEGCAELRKGDKQAKLSQEDLATILSMLR